MKYYRVTVAFTEVSGRLHLTDDQAAARKHQLEALGDNLFDTRDRVGFKRGEEFGSESPVAGAEELTGGARVFSRRIKAERDAVAKANAAKRQAKAGAVE